MITGAGCYAEATGRNAGFLSRHEQARLRGGAAFVVGVGGMGGAAATVLARAGVGRMAVADPDRFELSNLNRQPFASLHTLGRSKAEVARRALPSMQPGLEVEDVGPDWLEDVESILDRYPVVVNGMDDTAAGIRLYRAARERGAVVVDAYSSPHPSVTVVRPGDPRPEERLAFPTVGLPPHRFTEAMLEECRVREVEFVLTHTPALARFDEAVAMEILAGARPRSSYAPVVVLAGALMAHEALGLLAGKPAGTDAAGYFLDPWSGRVHRPHRGLRARIARALVRRRLRSSLSLRPGSPLPPTGWFGGPSGGAQTDARWPGARPHTHAGGGNGEPEPGTAPGAELPAPAPGGPSRWARRPGSRSPRGGDR